MANIIINVEELICEAPIFVNTNYTGSPYVFQIDWSSRGEEYKLFDSTTKLELSIEIVQTVPGTVDYTGVLEPTAEFDAIGYEFNVLDFFPIFSNKYTIKLTLALTGDRSCNETTEITLPVNYT